MAWLDMKSMVYSRVSFGVVGVRLCVCLSMCLGVNFVPVRNFLSGHPYVQVLRAETLVERFTARMYIDAGEGFMRLNS